MKLEEKVTKGFIVYIHSIDYDVVNKRLVIILLKNPEEQQRIARVLTFSNVQRVKTTYLDWITIRLKVHTLM